METRQLKELYNELCLLEGLLLKTVNDGATCAALNDLIKERGESVVRGVQELLAAIEMAEETAAAQEMKAPVEDMSAAEEAAAMAVAAAAMPPQINDEEMNEEVAQNEPLNPVRLTPPAMPENTSADAYYTEEEEESEEEHPDMSLDVFDEEDEEGENDRSVEGKHPDLSFITINERARFRNNLFNGNKQQFDDAMELLQSLTGFEEARRYLIDDLEWNPAENEIQAEFLDKLYLCFQQAR